MPQHSSFYRVIQGTLFTVGIILMLQGCESGGGGGSGGEGSQETLVETCADLSGLWNVTEEVAMTCTFDDETEPVTSILPPANGQTTLEQDDCTVGYTVPGFTEARTGDVEGQIVNISGPFAVAEDGIHFDQNFVEIEGELVDNTLMLIGTGRAEGTTDDGVHFACTGSSTATLERAGDSLEVAGLIEKSKTLSPIWLGETVLDFAIVGR